MEWLAELSPSLRLLIIVLILVAVRGLWREGSLLLERGKLEVQRAILMERLQEMGVLVKFSESSITGLHFSYSEEAQDLRDELFFPSAWNLEMHINYQKEQDMKGRDTDPLHIEGLIKEALEERRLARAEGRLAPLSELPELPEDIPPGAISQETLDSLAKEIKEETRLIEAETLGLLEENKKIIVTGEEKKEKDLHKWKEVLSNLQVSKDGAMYFPPGYLAEELARVEEELAQRKQEGSQEQPPQRDMEEGARLMGDLGSFVDSLVERKKQQKQPPYNID